MAFYPYGFWNVTVAFRLCAVFSTKKVHKLFDMSQQEITTAKTYMDARLASKPDTALQFVHDDIEFTSARDGTHNGKAAFAAYLAKTPPTGTWQDPVVENGQVVIRGKVKFALMIPVSVIAKFTFQDGKIRKLSIDRG